MVDREGVTLPLTHATKLPVAHPLVEADATSVHVRVLVARGVPLTLAHALTEGEPLIERVARAEALAVPTGKLVLVREEEGATDSLRLFTSDAVAAPDAV